MSRPALPAVPAEGARSDVIHLELDDLAERLRPVADPRACALAIVKALVTWCGSRTVGPADDDSIAEVALLYTLVRGSSQQHDLGLWCERADRLAARFFSRVGPGGLWPWEHRVPFELATALRRACEEDVARFLPLIVRDGRALLVDLGGDPGLVEQHVAAALGTGQP